MLDASEICTWVGGGAMYQGSAPEVGSTVADHGFDVLVLCAWENQDPNGEYKGVEVVRCPTEDVNPMDEDDIDRWRATARQVATLVIQGKKVLVTCIAGLNRSGMVSALALNELFGWSGKDCANHVRNDRYGALCNKSFRLWLELNVKERP